MTDTELFTQLMQATAIAAGLLTWALATAMIAPRTLYWRATVAVVSGLVTTSVLLTMLQQISTPWWIAICGGVFVLVPLTSPRLWLGLARWIQSLAVRNPSRVFALVALIIVGLGWGLAYHHYEQSQLAQADAMLSQQEARNAPLVAPASVLGVTDLGQTIELDLPVDPADLADLEDLEEASASIQQYQHHWLIRRGPPDDTANCHGWVFTNGKYNIAGRCVPTILDQNNYAKVKDPETGDLVVYRNSDNEISHTGIVRAVLGTNDVLIESKWGRMGVYLHPVEKSCYGKDFEYYRSERGSHVITMRAEKEKPEGAME
jgi:hypothetical protein